MVGAIAIDNVIRDKTVTTDAMMRGVIEGLGDSNG